MPERPPAWEKQKSARKFAVKRGKKGVGLFMEMGTGKTRVTIETIEEIMRDTTIKLGLVAAPLGVLHVWVQNWNDWSDRPVLFVDLHESGVAGLKRAVKMSKLGFLVVCLINYESSWQLGHERRKVKKRGKYVSEMTPVDLTLYDVQWDFIVADEATAIKNPSAKVSAFFVNKLAPMAKYRYALTGSAYLKRPLDVYSILKFVCGEEYMPRTFTQFKAMFTVPHPRIRGAILKYQNLSDLVARMAKCCVLLKKEDVLDLPPQIHQVRYVFLPKKAMKLYEKISTDLFAELEEYENEGKTVTITHVFSVMRKQLQVASGFVLADKEEGQKKADPIEIHEAKTAELIEVLDQRDGKPTVIVVQSDYSEVMVSRAIKKHFKVTPKILNGSVKGAERRINMIADAAHDPFFIVKEAVACEGNDMRWADMIIFYEHSANTSDYNQMLSRNHRGGQTRKCYYVHLLAKGTADERVMDILEGDLDLAKQIEKDWRKLLK